MLRPRIIPSLLVHKKGLNKTVQFKKDKYVGDPLNAVKIFNEKEVDELVVFDIDATVEGRGPDFKLIKDLAMECRMPFCYGGGVSTKEEAIKIVSLGAEKVALSSAVIQRPQLAAEIGQAIGNQSVVVVLDYKKKKGFFSGTSYEIYTHNGTKNTKLDLFGFVKVLEKLEVGEILLNSIDRDGMMNGYDLEVIEKVRDLTSVPISVLGGAGSLSDIETLVSKFKIIGAGAGSLFVFKGRYKAVLINYPNFEERKKIIST
jgi:cyclase